LSVSVVMSQGRREHREVRFRYGAGAVNVHAENCTETLKSVNRCSGDRRSAKNCNVFNPANAVICGKLDLL